MDYSDILSDIRKIVRSINLESKRIQKDFGISIPQLLCLGYLNGCSDYQASHGELTRFLHLNSSTVTGIVNRLQKKGLIARLPKKEDKRVTTIALTDSGAKVLEQTPDLLHEKLSAHLSRFSEAQVEGVKRSLELIVAALEIGDVDASPMITMEDPIAGKPGTEAF